MLLIENIWVINENGFFSFVLLMDSSPNRLKNHGFHVVLELNVILDALYGFQNKDLHNLNVVEILLSFLSIYLYI